MWTPSQHKVVLASRILNIDTGSERVYTKQSMLSIQTHTKQHKIWNKTAITLYIIKSDFYGQHLFSLIGVTEIEKMCFNH